MIGCRATLPSLFPLNLTGRKKKNSFALQYELVNELLWQSNPLETIRGYYLYRGETKIATLGGNIQQYQDHNQTAGVSTTYSVSSFDTAGNEGRLTSVTIL